MSQNVVDFCPLLSHKVLQNVEIRFAKLTIFFNNKVFPIFNFVFDVTRGMVHEMRQALKV
jgi:hypothetical protein